MSVADSTKRSAVPDRSATFAFRSCGVREFTFFTKRGLDRHELLRWHNASARHLFWFIQETYRKRTMFPLSHIPSNRRIFARQKMAREFLWKRDWGSLSLIESFKTKETSSMLVLSRKQSQRIRVGDSVIVTVVRVSGDKVRIGIEAPSNIRVLRDELEFDDQIELPMTPRPIGKAF